MGCNVLFLGFSMQCFNITGDHVELDQRSEKKLYILLFFLTAVFVPTVFTMAPRNTTCLPIYEVKSVALSRQSLIIPLLRRNSINQPSLLRFRLIDPSSTVNTAEKKQTYNAQPVNEEKG